MSPSVSGEPQSLQGLIRQLGDELEVFVEMENGELCELPGRGDEEVRDRWGAVSAAIGQGDLKRHRSILGYDASSD